MSELPTGEYYARGDVDALLAARDARIAELEARFERSTDWYQQRFNRLRTWCENEVRPLSAAVASRYYAICANGSPCAHESADWSNTMHELRFERDAALKRVEELKGRLKRTAEILRDALPGPHEGSYDAEEYAEELRTRVAELEASIKELTERDHCWHCRVRMVPVLHCEDCPPPGECDVDGCQADGCDGDIIGFSDILEDLGLTEKEGE